MKSLLPVTAIGHVQIVDKESGEVVLDKKNAIHPQNMATAIARALSHGSNGYISTLALGNGGTFYNSANQLNYRPPNTLGTADLYNVTYSEQVDSNANGTPVGNSVTSAQSPSPAITSIIIVTMELSSVEPAGQAASDDSTTATNSLYTFDELGLKTADGLLLTHMIFNPIEKTANRAFLITYTITVSVS
jgi:hypothetical protein